MKAQSRYRAVFTPSNTRHLPHAGRRAVSVIQVLSEPNGMAHRLCLDGLKPDARYRELASGKEYYGDTLMRAGILLPLQQADFTAQFYHFAMV